MTFVVVVILENEISPISRTPLQIVASSSSLVIRIIMWRNMTLAMLKYNLCNKFWRYQTNEPTDQHNVLFTWYR